MLSEHRIWAKPCTLQLRAQHVKWGKKLMHADTQTHTFTCSKLNKANVRASKQRAYTKAQMQSVTEAQVVRYVWPRVMQSSQRRAVSDNCPCHALLNTCELANEKLKKGMSVTKVRTHTDTHTTHYSHGTCAFFKDWQSPAEKLILRPKYMVSPICALCDICSGSWHHLAGIVKSKLQCRSG